MVVVSDTSSFYYFLLLRWGFILKELFGTVSIPVAVAEELLQTQEEFIDEALKQEWINIVSLTNRDLFNQLLLELDLGESEAIALAFESQASYLLIDERKGTAVARSLNLNTTGVLGVLLYAKDKGIIPEVKGYLDRLITETSFYCDAHLKSIVLQKANEQ